MIVLYVLIIVLWLLYLKRQWRFYFVKMTGPFGFPVIGNAIMFWDRDKIVQNIRQMGTSFPSPIKFWLGPRLFIYADLPDQVESILNSPDCLDKGDSYKFLEHAIGLGLITMKGAQWREQRKLLNSSFHYQVINSFFPIFNKHVSGLVKNLQKYADKGSFDILNSIKKCALEMTCETTMDIKCRAQTDGQRKSGPEAAYMDALDYALDVVAMRMFQVWLQPTFLFQFTKYYQKYNKSLEILRETVTNIIREKSDNYCKDKVTITNEDSDFFKEKNIFIDRAVKLCIEDKAFDEKQLMDETVSTLSAGYETTSSTTAFIMLMLAMHPEYQERLYQEIKSVILDRTTDITSAELKLMPYLDRVIKETLRLFPSVPYLTRTATNDFKLGERIIPKGSEFVLGVIHMHRAPGYFKDIPGMEPFDGEAFNPDHFLPERLVDKHPYSYIPFSAGIRTCIGKRYGEYAMKLLVIRILQSYRLTTKLKMSELRVRMSITLYLLNKHMVEIYPREDY